MPLCRQMRTRLVPNAEPCYDVRMSKFDKLLDRLDAIPPDMRYGELDTILRHFGYTPTETHGGSSHITYRKDNTLITIPRHTPIKRIYIKKVKEAIERERNS